MDISASKGGGESGGGAEPETEIRGCQFQAVSGFLQVVHANKRLAALAVQLRRRLRGSIGGRPQIRPKGLHFVGLEETRQRDPSILLQ